MTESEAIEELKYDCSELGKAIPCDTSWGCSFENAYGMAIKALEKHYEVDYEEYDYCPSCGQRIDWSDQDGLE